MRRLDDDRDATASIHRHRRAVQHDPRSRTQPHARHGRGGGVVGALVVAECLSRHGEHGGRQPARLPVAVGEVCQPSFDARGSRLHRPVRRQHHQARRVGRLGIRGLTDEQTSPRALGQVRRHARDEGDVLVAEQGAPRLAVQPDRAPDLAGRGAKPGDQLLVAAVLHVAVPAGAARRVAGGGLVEGRDASFRADDVGQLVQTVLVVLLGQPLVRELRQALLVVTGHQQGRRIQRVPAGAHVVRDDTLDDRRRLSPQAHEVQPVARELGDPILSPLGRVRRHPRTVRRPREKPNTTFLAWIRDRFRPSFAAMTAGARTPEELDALLEDAFVQRDRSVTDTLFDDRAVLVESGGLEARGGVAIAATIAELWRRNRIYVARPGQVLRTHDTALWEVHDLSSSLMSQDRQDVDRSLHSG